MRIALISTPFVAVPPRRYGGTELVIAELAEGLALRGHDVHLFATGDSQSRATLNALYPQAQWPPDPVTDLNHVSWAMQQVVERGPFHVVHAHSPVALACARLLPAVPIVYTLRHERDERLSAFYGYCQDTHFVAVSDDQRRRETALRDLTVIHHGLDPAKYEFAPRPAGDYVCFVGRLSRVKGPHTAMRAAALAGTSIHVAGEAHPPDESWAAAELRPLLVEPHVRYLGGIGLTQKVSLLRDARALLAPIEWNEPFGLTLIEAMLSGCPVVAFARGSVPELLEEGITGFVASSIEHMAELIRPGGAVDAFDRTRCRERAIERFSRDRMVDAHIALYARVAACPPVLGVGQRTLILA